MLGKQMHRPSVSKFLPVAAAVLVASVLSPARADAAVGGNAVVARSFSDGFRDFTIVDRNNDIDVTTSLTSWSVWINDANAAGTVELAIFRESGNTLTLVGHSGLQNAVAGLNTFALSTPMAVQQGDFVGLHMGSGVVAFDNSGAGGSVMSYSDNLAGLTTAMAGSTQRTYSVEVSAVPEPGTWALMVGGAVLVAAATGRRRRAQR